MRQHLDGRKFIIAWSLLISILYIIVFTGSCSSIALTPHTYIFTVRKAGNWLRVGNFGACFGTGDLSSAPISCAPIVSAGISMPDTAKDKEAAASLLVTHAKKMQLGIFPLFSMLAGVSYLISAICVAKWRHPGYTRAVKQPGTRYKYCTFDAAWVSISMSVAALSQTWASVFGMVHAAAAATVDSAEFEIKLNMTGLMLQVVALILQLVYVAYMYYMYSARGQTHFSRSARGRGDSGQRRSRDTAKHPRHRGDPGHVV